MRACRTPNLPVSCSTDPTRLIGALIGRSMKKPSGTHTVLATMTGGPGSSADSVPK